MLVLDFLVSDFYHELVTGKCIPYISLFVIAFCRDVVEYDIRLLDESASKLDPLRSLKVKLFLFLFGLCRSFSHLLLNLFCLHSVEFLDHWTAFRSRFTSRGLELEACLIVFLITTEFDSISEVRLIILIVFTSSLSVFVDAQEVFAADRHRIPPVFVVFSIIRCGGDPRSVFIFELLFILVVHIHYELPFRMSFNALVDHLFDSFGTDCSTITARIFLVIFTFIVCACVSRLRTPDSIFIRASFVCVFLQSRLLELIVLFLALAFGLKVLIVVLVGVTLRVLSKAHDR